MSVCCSLNRKVVSAIDNLNEWIGLVVSWCTLAMVVITFIIVMLRYIFDFGWIALQESVIYLHVLVFMWGAAYTLKHDGHVRVDIFYQRCSARGQAWIDCLGALFLLIPVCVFIAVSSWGYVADSWKILESSRNSGGLPGLFLLKSCILLMAVLLVLQGLSLFLSKLTFLIAPEQRVVD